MNAPIFSAVPLTLDQWAQREIQRKDFLLGEVFGTTTRAILSADTGLGKTHFAMTLGLHMAAGRDFCHWRYPKRIGVDPHGNEYERPPPRVLFIDGEMARELMQERLADAERRLGERPDTFFCLCKEDVADMPPLDALDGNDEMVGQQYLEHLIGHISLIDFIIFDNIGSLTVRNLADPESWLPMVPYMRHLTREHIGQLWINHTGHDKSRDYGPRMRLWQMDVAMVATKLDNHAADIAFKLEFVKARQRKPSNRADFEPVNVILEHDEWSTSAAQADKKTTYGKNQKIILEGLEFILATAGEPSPGTNGLPTSATIASRDYLRHHCIAKMPQDSDRRRKFAYEQAFESLAVPGGPIGVLGGHVWNAS
jgi:AAA domain